MKPSRNTCQLSLFDDLHKPEVSEKSKSVVQTGVVINSDKEGKVISLIDYKYKKAEEKYKSYSAHLL